MMPRRNSGASPAVSGAVRWAWFVIGGILTLGVLAGGGFLVWQVITGNGLSQQTEQSSLTSDGTPETVVVEGTSSNVRFTGADIESAALDLALSWHASERPAVGTEWQGSAWLVDLDCRHVGLPLWFAPGCGIDLSGQMPEASDIGVRLTSGAATVEDLSGAVDLETTSGDILLDGVSGNLRTQSSSGSVLADRLASPRTISETTSGEVFLEYEEAPERVVVSTTAGGVDIQVPRAGGYRVETSTSAGAVEVGIADDPEAERIIDVSTTSGDVAINYAD